MTHSTQRGSDPRDSGLAATGIPLRDLHLVWPDLWPLLEPAVKRSPDYSAGDRAGPDACPEPAEWVLAELIAHRADLWAIYEHGKPVAAIVTAVQHESEKRCLVGLVGGSRLRDWAGEFMATLEGIARTEGCAAIWACGRKGWARVAPLFGWERIADHNGQHAWQRRIA